MKVSGDQFRIKSEQKVALPNTLPRLDKHLSELSSDGRPDAIGLATDLQPGAIRGDVDRDFGS